MQNWLFLMFAGCTVDVIQKGPFYKALKSNELLVDLYVKNAATFNVVFDDDLKNMGGSTDMGNVFQIKPSIHPNIRIPTDGVNHTHEFTKAAGSKEAQLPTLISAKCMAMTAIDLICNPKLLVDVKEKFNKN